MTAAPAGSYRIRGKPFERSGAPVRPLVNLSTRLIALGRKARRRSRRAEEREECDEDEARTKIISDDAIGFVPLKTQQILTRVMNNLFRRGV